MKNSINVMVIQLTRTGDILQTYQMAKHAKLEHPNLKFSLITRKKFSTGISFLLSEVFENIYEIDVKDFFNQGNKLNPAVSQVDNFIKNINETSYDLLINLSFNKSSSYLASLINTKVRMGIYRNSFGEIAINDKWSQYVYATVMAGAQNPINLVEIYRNILGVRFYNPEPNHEIKEKNIVIHPFASHVKKKWPMHKWSEVIYSLAKDHPHHKITILGGESDNKEQEMLKNNPALQEINSPIEFLAGQHSMEHSFNLLKKATLFIGHDSMVSHMAAINDIPSIIISLGTVRPAETSPYFNKVINIVPKSGCFPCQLETSCELMTCHKDINHQVVSAISNLILNDEEISKDKLFEYLSTFHLSSCKLYYSNVSDKGNYELINFTDDYLSFDDCIHTYYRLIWNIYFKNEDIPIGMPNISQNTASKLVENTQGIQYLFELFNFGSKYSKQLVEEGSKNNSDSIKVKNLVSKLTEIDRLCEITKKTYPLLTPLIDYFYVAKANAPGDNLTEIAENYLVLYHDASNLSAMIYELVENTLKAHGEYIINKEAETNTKII